MLKTVPLRSVVVATAYSFAFSLGSVAIADGVDGGGSSAAVEASEGGGATVSVSVSYTTTSSGLEGGQSAAVSSSQVVTTTVPPICWYKEHGTGPDVAASAREIPDPTPGQRVTIKPRIQNWRDHETDTEGMWYMPTCSRERAPDNETYERVYREFYRTAEPLWVPAGTQPPEPVIDGRTLAEAAWHVIDLPAPTVEHNPTLGDSGATLVGWHTWVWATGETPTGVQATATAGPNTATVTASASGLDLSAPDAEQQCSGFGVPWSPQTQHTDCSIVFTRSSAHLGGTTPMTV